MGLSWDAKRRGGIYCAPACGGGCTWKSYLEAKAKGEALAKKMGAGWTPHVWENSGWHYCVKKAKVLKLHCSYGCYSAYLGKTEAGGRWGFSSKSAKKAVAGVLAKAQEEVNEISLLLRLVEFDFPAKKR